MKWMTNLLGKNNQEITQIYNGPLEQLHTSDVESIYHHLHPGTEVELKVEQGTSSTEPRIVAFYKGFRLGFIPAAYTPVVAQLISRGFFLKSNIEQVVREKYLPAEQLNISITDQFTQA